MKFGVVVKTEVGSLVAITLQEAYGTNAAVHLG